MQFFPSIREETRLPPPQGSSQIWMWVALEATTSITTMQDHCCLPHRETQTCICISGWLILFLEIIDYATFALTMQFKARHTLCWSVSYIIPLEINFHRYFRKQYKGASSLFFQSDHQVEISVYLPKAITLCHFKELAGLKPSWCVFRPISFLAS